MPAHSERRLDQWQGPTGVRRHLTYSYSRCDPAQRAPITPELTTNTVTELSFWSAGMSARRTCCFGNPLTFNGLVYSNPAVPSLPSQQAFDPPGCGPGGILCVLLEPPSAR